MSSRSSSAGPRPLQPHEIGRVEDRITFIYLEHCQIHRDANAITITDARGVAHFPAASVSVAMLGPGTSISHQAVATLADSGSAITWVGEHGVRFYAGGRPLSRNTRLLETQARLVSNERSRLDIARRMYGMRFPGEDVSTSTMRQLRGKEGSRMKRGYRDMAQRYGIPWEGRRFDPNDFHDGDPANQALSAATTSLYGVVHAVICAIGCSTGLGFIHTGHERSFVYDIADLYKLDTAVQVAFETVASADELDDIPALVRQGMRNNFNENRIINRIVTDIFALLMPANTDAETAALQDPGDDIVELWDPSGTSLPAGMNWTETFE